MRSGPRTARSIFIGKYREGVNENTRDPGNDAFWRVPIDGSPAHVVRFDHNMGLSARVHPDGRRLIYAVQPERIQTEVWVLENFFSALKPR